MLPDAGKFDFVTTVPRPFSQIYPQASSQLLTVIEGMLRLSPARRVTANTALRDTWFEGTLVPCPAGACYGNDIRIDLSSRCVEERDGLRMVDLLRPELQQAEEKWT